MTHSNSRYVTVRTVQHTFQRDLRSQREIIVQFDFDGKTCFDFISFYFIAIRAHFSFLRLLSSTTPKKPSKHWQTGSIFPVCLLVYSHDFDCPGHISRTVRIRIRIAERLNKKIKSRFILLYSILIQFRSRIDSSADANLAADASGVKEEEQWGKTEENRKIWKQIEDWIFPFDFNAYFDECSLLTSSSSSPFSFIAVISIYPTPSTSRADSYLEIICPSLDTL